MFNLFLFFAYSATLLYKLAVPLTATLISDWPLVTYDMTLQGMTNNSFHISMLLPFLIVIICFALGAGFAAMTAKLIELSHNTISALAMPREIKSHQSRKKT